MASLPSIRRSLTTLASRAANQAPAHVAPRSAAAIFNRECLSKRTFGTSGLPGQSRARFGAGALSDVQRQSQFKQSIRRKSDNGEPLRQWGFEDINAALPTDPNAASPPATPQKNLILVDVREPAELNSTGIIPSAVSVPLASQPDAFFLTPDEFETRFGYPKPGAEEDQTQEIVFYCKAGVRARAAAQLAVQAGYDPAKLGVYDGSWLDWVDHEGKVERWEGPDYD
ncbi:hypothetical protein ASPWEDRAFT_169364 [Aspergillus wentii DTO 134E9]|uniref:Rhodanese domain-containing protein n=1 Tax=Aspergillus wentii DTO 134E9 TaxID=1073089 RepID=A0A1L9RX67_ASPWE|nr:uncharacterized protein ASPWEDRAFT_169364 [Aspergillus wentii DTO 134E9]KAI9931794.1 hypothetical protein MW887_010373 [Aspergillus wentii]OJJ39522.1 hypothetical protein ASPWEDRAFT_169364 [Aspergillus wentii DTO 134E9]